MGLPSSVLPQTISEVKAKITIVSYIVLIEIPFFLSLLVSFYKDCLIFKRNDFILTIFQILFQRWLYNKLLQTLIVAGNRAE